jgi:hypothetical protein
MLFHLLADRKAMGRLIYFPNIAADAPASENRVASDSVMNADIESDALGLDPSGWGIPRTFFLVQPSAEDAAPDTQSVS